MRSIWYNVVIKFSCPSEPLTAHACMEAGKGSGGRGERLSMSKEAAQPPVSTPVRLCEWHSLNGQTAGRRRMALAERPDCRAAANGTR
ncbi:hypothetical protein K280104A7_10060 [Candidatus Bariatricus faecipullorum]